MQPHGLQRLSGYKIIRFKLKISKHFEGAHFENGWHLRYQMTEIISILFRRPSSSTSALNQKPQPNIQNNEC